MSYVDSVLQKNKEYVKKHDKSSADSSDTFKKLAILTCMDARLEGVLPEAMGLKSGEAVFIKTAGNNLFYGEIRSVMAAVFKLEVTNLFVVGHEDCGMSKWRLEELKESMLKRGVKKEDIAEYDDMERWMGCFKDIKENIISTVKAIRTYSLTPPDLEIHGLYFEMSTGKIEKII